MLIIGDKEVAASTVSVRLRSGEQATAQSFDSFKESVKLAVANKMKDLRL
jgi:threonyl-tRNA synthetase